VKPPDLSTRQNGIVKAPSSPVFSRRNANPTGTLTFAAAGSQPLYKAPGSVTVLWILFQLQSATTVQLFKNGEALSASYQLNAGAIVRYAGLLLLGNETLSLSVSGACVVTYELAWVKEHDERLITTDTSISNPSSGGTVTVSNFPAIQPVSGFPGQYPIADTLGNQFLSDGAGSQRVNPTGPAGSFRSSVQSVAGNLQNTITVPAGKKWIVKAAAIIPTTNATAGTRTPSFYITDAATNVLCNINAAVGMGASLTAYFNFGPSLPLATVLTSSTATCPIPEFVLGPGFTVNGSFNGGLAGDTFKLNLTIIELPN
jgi:hypothetical protein